jgi:hypothetical protein
MSTLSINNLSANYSQATLGTASAQTGKQCSQKSPAASDTGAPAFSQLLSSFQTNETQNQGQSLDPLSVF